MTYRSRFAVFLLSLALLAPAACVTDANDPLAPGAEDDRSDVPVSADGLVRIRVMAANISSGNYQSYDPGHGIRIFQGTDPDIVLIQEFNYGNNTSSDIRSFVDTAFGPTFSYYREGGDEQIPNGVISRYPIIESGEWIDPYVSNRDFAYVRIDIPGPVDLWAVSLHLLTSSSTSRNSQATALVSNIRQRIPAGDFLVVGGDLNTGSRTESCISTLGQVVDTRGPYPADRNGNTNTNATRSKPYDWVLVDGDLRIYETSVDIGATSFANGLVLDTRVYSPLAEISPAQLGDSSATNMQHMGVYRDFLVPGDGFGGEPDAGPGPSPDAGVPAGSPVVFINEILANEPGSNTAGEFVEIVNKGTGPADLSGWKLADGGSVRHTFASGTTLNANAGIVVFASAAGIPAGTPNAIGASTGTLGLSNSGDSVILRDANNATVDSFTYPSSLAGTDAVSMNRSPDATLGGTFVLHTTLGGTSSPGTSANGAPF